MTEMKRRLRGALCSLRGALSGRSLWACLLALSLAGTILTISQKTRVVYIQDGGLTTMHYTLKQEPEQILDDNGIATMAFDVVDFSGFEDKMGVISIKRAFPVTIKADGMVRSLMTTEMTVGELLKQEQIPLDQFDTINIDPVLHLIPGDTVVIERVEMTRTVVDTAIPYGTVYKDNALLKEGKTKLLSGGRDGLRRATYLDRVVDGAVVSRELIGEEILREPVDELVLRGANKPVSDLDFGVPLDGNGVPVRYKQVLTNQICTGYSAGKGAYGASMMNLYDGYVAVRADEIPYGTKMYITSPDNSFVYGFAIAADTGIGLMNDVIDIDLFYETYTESCLNGRKYLNVYILE